MFIYETKFRTFIAAARTTLFPVLVIFFSSQAGPPDQSIIPENDVLGVTVVLITCSFRNQEFVRVGYYVNNEYEDPVLRENPPSTVEFAKVCTKVKS